MPKRYRTTSDNSGMLDNHSAGTRTSGSASRQGLQMILRHVQYGQLGCRCQEAGRQFGEEIGLENWGKPSSGYGLGRNPARMPFPRSEGHVLPAGECVP